MKILDLKPTFECKGKFDKALIDGDMIAYSVASACDGHYYEIEDTVSGKSVFQCRYKKELNDYIEVNPLQAYHKINDDYDPEPLDKCLHSVQIMLDSILESIGAKDYQIYLSGGKNFRYDINPLYKAHRKDKRKPYHLENCQQYMKEKYNAVFTDGIEADDALGINQDKVGWTTVIASIDKDMKCIPGWHYRWSHHGKDEELFHISVDDANRNLYKQILVGDRTDNIFSIKGVAEKTAHKLLEKVPNEKLQDVVLDLFQFYKNPLRLGFKSQQKWAEKRLHDVASLIYILRGENEYWNKDVLKTVN